jgi:hypothetical protein
MGAVRFNRHGGAVRFQPVMAARSDFNPAGRARSGSTGAVGAVRFNPSWRRGSVQPGMAVRSSSIRHPAWG